MCKNYSSSYHIYDQALRPNVQTYAQMQPLFIKFTFLTIFCSFSTEGKKITHPAKEVGDSLH